MRVERANIREYYGTDPSLVDVARLNRIFEHIPHYSVYRGRIRGLLEKGRFGHRELEDLLQWIDDMLALSSRGRLEQAFERLKHDIEGRMGVFEVHQDALVFGSHCRKNLLELATLGNSSHAFFLTLLLRIDHCLKRDLEALEIFEGLEGRLSHLANVQQEDRQQVEEQVVSEFILAHSASLLKDLRSICNTSLRDELRLKAGEHLEEVLDVVRGELGAIDRRISDGLIFLSQLHKLRQSSKAHHERCDRSLRKMNREFLSLMMLLSQADLVVEERGLMKGGVVDNLRLNLYFALLLLPFSEAFRNKYQESVCGKLMQLSHHANFLRDFHLEGLQDLMFPEGCTLGFDNLPPFPGRKVGEVLDDLQRLVEEDERKNVSLRWNLYLKIELHLRNLESEEEKKAVIAAKVLLLNQMMCRHTNRTMTFWLDLDGTLKTLTETESYLSRDVLNLLREACHGLSHLLDRAHGKVRNLYEDHLDGVFQLRERDPLFTYRRQGARQLVQIKNRNHEEVGPALEEIHDHLLSVLEKGREPSAAGKILDDVVREVGPYNGGLLDILDDPDLLREMMENPVIKNQSLHRKRMVQMLQLTRTLLKG